MYDSAPTARETFDLLMWREWLAASAPVPDVAQQLEWAGRLYHAGAADAGKLLRFAAFIRQGYSPELRAARAGKRLAAAIVADDASVRSSSEQWTIHLALSELQALADEHAPSLIPLPKNASSGRPDNPAGIGPGIPAPAIPDDIASMVHRLHAILDCHADPVAIAEVADIVARLREVDRRLPGFDFRVFARAPLGTVVATIALAGLVDHALGTQDLVAAPLGSPAFLHRAARLSHAGLGPYLTNVSRLVRNSRDIFDLADIAAAASEKTGANRSARGAWIALLSRDCHIPLLSEVIDDLGDLDDSETLGAILDRLGSRPRSMINVEMVMRVRDAALDNGDYHLAARAQKIVVRLEPEIELEILILGSIQASGGYFAEAEDTFRHCLMLRPGTPDTLDRLKATKMNDFSAFVVRRGFGSPADRQDMRLLRRGRVPDYSRRLGERIFAVET